MPSHFQVHRSNSQTHPGFFLGSILVTHATKCLPRSLSLSHSLPPSPSLSLSLYLHSCSVYMLFCVCISSKTLPSVDSFLGTSEWQADTHTHIYIYIYIYIHAPTPFAMTAWLPIFRYGCTKAYLCICIYCTALALNLDENYRRVLIGLLALNPKP